MEQLPEGKKGGEETISEQNKTEEKGVEVFHREGDRKLKDFAIQLVNVNWHVQHEANGMVNAKIVLEKPDDFSEYMTFTADEFYYNEKYNFHFVGEKPSEGNLLDSSCALAEAAERLRDKATQPENLAKDGWELSGTILDDYGDGRCKPKLESIGNFVLK